MHVGLQFEFESPLVESIKATILTKCKPFVAQGYHIMEEHVPNSVLIEKSLSVDDDLPQIPFQKGCNTKSNSSKE